MGRKGNWFRSVKKAFNSGTKEQQEEIPTKSKKRWFSRKKSPYPIANPTSTLVADPPATPRVQPPAQVAPEPSPPTIQKAEDTKSTNLASEAVDEGEQVAASTTRMVEQVTVETQEVTEQANPKSAATSDRFAGKSKEEVAAITIQTAFRRYLAKRALRVLRGLVRLKNIMHSSALKRQTASTLKSMQALSHIQTQIHAQRVRMSEENQARQQQLLSKQAKELDKLQILQQNSGDWDLSLKSKEQRQAVMQSKHEAAMRRERAMAYSFNHQQTWRSSTTLRSSHNLFLDSTNPHWGWSWLERWVAARPWEATNISDAISDFASPKGGSLYNTSSRGGSQIAKALLYHIASEKTGPSSTTSSPRASASPRSASRAAKTSSSLVTTSRASTSTPPSNSRPRSSSASTRKLRSASPRQSPRKSMNLSNAGDDDARSVLSLQSDLGGRRRSVAGSSVGGDDLESLKSLPSYMAPTESAKARSRIGSPLECKHDNTDRLRVSSAKNRLSHPSSPARSRCSASSITDVLSIGK